jgi:hypothetical protein
MNFLGEMIPLENWLSGDVIDLELRGPIAKARAEFAGQSEAHVRALWQRLEIIIHEWQTSSGRALPTYRSQFRKVGDTLVYDGPGRGDVKPDYLAALRQLARQKHPPLTRYLMSLDKQVPVTFLKMFALLILREAGDGNPRGALAASGEFDKVYVRLRAMTDKGLRIHKGRQLGAKKAAAQKAMDKKDRDQEIVTTAKKLLAANHERREIAGILAGKFHLSSRTIRRILKTAGI